MEKRAREFYKRKGYLDRISSLPDDVINMILIRLPIRDAVGTCMLSTTWRYKWMFIPELIFNEPESCFDEQKFDKWVSFINNVLYLHEGNITRFEITNWLDSASSNVDRWLRLISRKGLNVLNIQFRRPNSYVCPSSLLSCRALGWLLLDGCGLQVPLQSQLKGFRNLVVLGLLNVTVNQETIESIVSNSPFLQILTISYPRPNVSGLNINAPNLRWCTIEGCCEFINFIKTPKLTFMDIKICVNGEGLRCKLDRNLDILCKLQEARISHPFMECLSVNNFWEALPVTYNHLKSLCLEICFEDAEQILSAFWLFRSSRSLKTISIHSAVCVNRDVGHVDLRLEEFYDALGREESILQSLEVFEFEWFDGSDREMKLIEFVLLKARVLQTMTINWSRIPFLDSSRCVEDLKRKNKALVKLVQFQRTSSKLKINIIETPFSCWRLKFRR